MTFPRCAIMVAGFDDGHPLSLTFDGRSHSAKLPSPDGDLYKHHKGI